ncbi:PREDICTED: outer envelope pore protein 21, chloroplastic-like isoform X2 [Nelumbo nucifera]|uniref:Outer envelope pore protein 21, chloroplastic-like isoform X2 n=1 Tax=Nelumbo nucifera TaxID=4432 RepID=A0A1U8AJX2_NELNU|nr:PREDICTED: outer envelope pore protein 21, chloroplastic-like isoform X2 [Nelumbo nucifera]
METSLRYGGDSKALRVHFKEKLPINSNNYFQVDGDLDTGIGDLSSLSGTIRCFVPELSAIFGLGLQYDIHDKANFIARGKKAFPIANNGLLSFKMKGRCEFDKALRKVPYLQIRENNWTLNADINGRWNVRFDL